MTRRPPASTSMQADFAERFAGDFEAVLLHNKVWDDVDEDDQLARLCDAAAMADAAGDLRVSYLGEDMPYTDDVDECAGTLEYVARQRALEAVAVVCAEVIQHGDEWTDAWEETSIEGAKHEAREWLQTHTNEAARVGVLDSL